VLLETVFVKKLKLTSLSQRRKKAWVVRTAFPTQTIFMLGNTDTSFLKTVAEA